MTPQKTFPMQGQFLSLIVSVSVAICFIMPMTHAAAQTPGVSSDGAIITLPAPDKEGGIPLMQALAKRQSGQSFKDEALPRQELSNLLWAAFGINRADGHRTAPTARNRQNVLIYAAMEGGIWRYEAEKQQLVKVRDTDMRATYKAPLTLLYAGEGDFAAMHVGALYQNVGLYCASAGLSNRVKTTGVDEARKEVPVPNGYQVMIIQNVGYPG